MSRVLSYRRRIVGALESGWHFGGLHASSDGSGVSALLVHGAAARLEQVAAVDGRVPTIVDLVPAAAWDEREAHDLQHVGFDGHEPLRPLVDHDLRLERWTVPVRGHDPYQVAVGPIHAGVIESGHFRFHVVGDRILHLDARLFYKHRGLERAAEGKTLEEGLVYVSRACAACAVANGVAYALACESLLGLNAPTDVRRVRTILLELERVWSHLNDIGQLCAGAGMAAGASRFAALTERARRLNAALGGHRFLFRTVAIGGSALNVGEETVAASHRELRELEREARSGWRELIFNASFQDRLPDIGVVDAAAVARLGAVGPAARAAGVASDVRAFSPALAYDGFEPVVPERAVGDVQARLEQRAVELWQSFGILDPLLDGPIRPVRGTVEDEERQVGVGRVESARGATSCVVEREGDRIARLRLRTGSYANWPAVAYAAVDNLLPDFPLINKSFELCYACADR